MRLVAALLALAVVGCAGRTSGAQSPTTGNAQGAPAAAPVAARETAPAPAPAPPAGFVTATVQTVIPTPDGNALLLTEPSGARVVPVMIGEAEAMVIALRLRGEQYERPLTHDLLDTIVRELGGTIVMVQIDKLRTGVFIGSVFVWDGRTMHRLDSRTSDAVAIALGHRAPIYVSTSVFDEAGIPAPTR